MEEYREQYNSRKRRNEELLNDIAELEAHVHQFEKSVHIKRQRINKHKEVEKKYIKSIEDIKKIYKLKQIDKAASQQLPINGSKQHSPEFICDKLEKLIEHQHTFKDNATSLELARIQPTIKEMISSSNVDYLRQLGQSLEHVTTKIKIENKQQYKTEKDKDDTDKRILQNEITKGHAERISESKRLFQVKNRLEQETREAELRLAKRVRELYGDPTIQAHIIKKLRLKAACQQVNTEVQLTKLQVDKLQHQVQVLEAQAKSQDLSMAIEDLMTIMAEKQQRAKSLLKTNDTCRKNLLEQTLQQKELMQKKKELVLQCFQN
ncbi:hypothetical protein G6F16_009204 [Rhizopus arrhizus]|uniref:DUF4201 domain-containing protein n=1 Tax=Rhizopus oryzae TaxID=64495 RepID=A0A9P6X1F2_RHIOR|nr:hypothetical protein G6F23_006682 [Rhizopus arrhizus]KAG0760556.1 hypothetical protein G6F24_008230 [Rhizopus arrhizus]KAG0783588.1 hypothetical protein G6F21_010444 [Rhizopus arrhizus]KAG0806867.1 hypothetical protein G6F20_010789 [Rhizopus arrhizus]KAG0826754.1 hypothetical protein G6F19_009140 [Rhizopus arrhizus]